MKEHSEGMRADHEVLEVPRRQTYVDYIMFYSSNNVIPFSTSETVYLVGGERWTIHDKQIKLINFGSKIVCKKVWRETKVRRLM